jgi:hypothetical protein
MLANCIKVIVLGFFSVFGMLSCFSQNPVTLQDVVSNSMLINSDLDGKVSELDSIDLDSISVIPAVVQEMQKLDIQSLRERRHYTLKIPYFSKSNSRIGAFFVQYSILDESVHFNIVDGEFVAKLDDGFEKSYLFYSPCVFWLSGAKLVVLKWSSESFSRIHDGTLPLPSWVWELGTDLSPKCGIKRSSSANYLRYAELHVDRAAEKIVGTRSVETDIAAEQLANLSAEVIASQSLLQCMQDWTQVNVKELGEMFETEMNLWW